MYSRHTIHQTDQAKVLPKQESNLGLHIVSCKDHTPILFDQISLHSWSHDQLKTSELPEQINGIRPPIHFYVLQFWASYDITWPKPFHYSCPNRNRNLWEIVAYIMTWMTYIEMATSPQNPHSTALYTFQGIQWCKFQTSGWDKISKCSSH